MCRGPGRPGWRLRWLQKKSSKELQGSLVSEWLNACLKGRGQLLAYPFSASSPGVLFSNGWLWRKLGNFALGTLT